MAEQKWEGAKMQRKMKAMGTQSHPGFELRANLSSISHKCHLFEVAFVWELTKETIHLPLGCLQGGEPLIMFSRLSPGGQDQILVLTVLYVSLNPQPSTLNPQPNARNPKPETRNPNPETYTRNPTPHTPHLIPKILNPKLETTNQVA